MISKIKTILSKIPHGEGSSQMQQGEQLQAESKTYRFDPKNIAPPQIQQKLWALLKWRDGIYRSVTNLIDSVPGLESLIDNLGESLDTCKFLSHLAFAFTRGTSPAHRCIHNLGSMVVGERDTRL